jgi:hypothetical protein
LFIPTAKSELPTATKDASTFTGTLVFTATSSAVTSATEISFSDDMYN